MKLHATNVFKHNLVSSSTVVLLNLPKCHVLVDVGDHGTPSLSILRQPHQSSTVISPGISSTRLHPNFSLCLPLALLPCIIPRNTSFSKQSCLSRCPKNINCLFLTAPSSSLLTPAICITLSLVTIAVHGTLSILLKSTSLLHQVSSTISDPRSRPRIRRPRLTR